MSSLNGGEDKQIDSDTRTFINTLISESHQEVPFMGWADIIYTDKKRKPRLLVLTNFRLYLIKLGVMGRSVRQSFVFLHLKEMVSQRDNQLILHFDDDNYAKEFGYAFGCELLFISVLLHDILLVNYFTFVARLTITILTSPLFF